MKKIILLLSILIITPLLLAQEMPQLIPPSPNTASLNRYGGVPVGLFTGSPQVNVPIYECKSRNLSVPISLNYSSNGVRVDEYSSNVGLGWNLSAGGVITRSINGEPDENPQADEPDFFGSTYSESMLSFLESHVTGIGSPGAYDTQPDVFSFNFNGFSGSFYLDDNSDLPSSRDVIIMDPSPLKITTLESGRVITGFKIKDPKGVEYVFEDIESSSSSSSCTSNNPNPISGAVSKAWHLTEINHPLGDKIELEYEQKQIIYDNGVSQNVTRLISEQRAAGGVPDSRQICLQTSTNFVPVLKRIKGSFCTVDFSYSHKSGMPANFDKLDKISIKNNDVTLEKEYILDYYSEISSTNASLLHSTQLKSYHRKRFYLKSVQEFVSENNKPAFEFEYYEPEDLPPRFSGGQDTWGYFNGKTTNINLIGQKTIEANEPNFLPNQFSSFIAADRKPSHTYAKKGILTKVKYPTGGEDMINYEGHSHSVVGLNFPDPDRYLIDVVNIDSPSGFISNSKTTQVVEYNQYVKLNFILTDKGGNPIPTDDGSQPTSDQPRTIFFTIKEKDTDIQPEFSEKIGSVYQPRAIDYITDENKNKEYYVRLEKNKSYEVRIGVSIDALAKVFFDIQKFPENILVNEEVGGLRVSSVETFSDGKSVSKKKYKYASFDSPNNSSGVVINRNYNPLTTRFTLHTGSEGWYGTENVKTTGTISSNSAYPVYGSYHIGYKTVITEEEGSASNGLVETTFSTKRIGSTLEDMTTYIPSTSLSNFFLFGKEIKSTIYKKDENEFVKLSSSENFYKHDERLDKKIIGYNIRRNANVEQNDNLSNKINKFDITSFSKSRQWHYLDKVISMEFFNELEDTLITTSKYYYNNTNHLQKTKIVKTLNSNDSLITQIKYAHDLNDTRLIAENRIIEPLEVLNYKNNTALSKQKTVYDIVLGNYLPQIIQTAKNAQALEDRIVYHNYDDMGNPTELSKEGGTHIVYIWGYQQTQPIAKIENTKLVDVETVIASLNSNYSALYKIQIISNEDNDREIDNIQPNGTITYNGNEGKLREALNDIRNHPDMSNAQVTTYTYDPLIGITSVTDPKGYTMYYEYDEFDRLKQVKDANGNVLSKNEYHYKN